jgi:competence protein ComEC
MGGLSALALIVGRQEHTLTSLFAAAWLMTAWQPFTLWEIGFQLSFAASLGLILYLGKLAAAFENALCRFVSMEIAQRMAVVLREGLLATLAALLTTLPWMVYHFGNFSPLTLVANLLVLPVQPTIMYLGSTAAMAGLVFLPLGRMLGWAAWLFLTYTIRMVEVLANWTRSSGTANPIHPALLLAYYGLLALLTLKPPSTPLSMKAVKRLLSRTAMRRAVVSALIIVLVLVWATVASLPDGRLHVAFLDVGQGDAILVQTPAGHRLLIDGGPSPAALLAALGRRLPFWDRRIDLVMLTHPHEDHLRGLLPLLDRYQVRQALVGEADHGSGVYMEWQRLLQENGDPLLVVQQPLRVDFGDGPTMDVLPPADGNPNSLDEISLVARLVWQKASFLFTADLEADGLLDLRYAGWPLACTVLKVPHHGSDEALNEELLAATVPDLAVISVGADNRFGHPAAETLECLEDAGIGVLRTDQVGTVEVTTDGDRYWVHTGGSQ